MRKSKLRAAVLKIKQHNTIGVRFLDGNQLAKVFTYRIPSRARVHLGQEIVVPTDKQANGYITFSVAVVVEIHSKPRDNDTSLEYRFARGTIKPF